MAIVTATAKHSSTRTAAQLFHLYNQKQSQSQSHHAKQGGHKNHKVITPNHNHHHHHHPYPKTISSPNPNRTTPTTPTTTNRPTTWGPRTGPINIMIMIKLPHMLPPSPNSNWNPLHNPAMVMACRVHTVIHREIAADQVGAHRGAFARQCFWCVHRVCLVFAVVDAYYARVPACVCVGVVSWFGPVAAAAEACFFVRSFF